ncbi:sugar ABC transporter substrate-binding protein [Nocardia sp. NPDC049220]|uniref:ABC transporter substrate-binding protein n=1 Tax=Nocardia sp. NPDC049220 TaxID=3155273 RepID=UPI0033E45817
MRDSTRAALGMISAAVLLVAAALWLRNDSDGSEHTVVRLRIWDQSFAPTYRASLDAFQAANPDIEVRLTVVPFAAYPQKLRLDVAGNTADDLFWTTLYEDYADNGHLLDIGRELGPDAARGWDAFAVAQFTRNDRLWVVPQFVDGGSAVFYNRDLLTKAGIDPAELGTVHWSADPDSDTFRPLLRKLAAVAPWPYNAANDFQSIVLPYLGSAGGEFQQDDRFVFDGPAGRTAFSYLVGLVADRLAPSGADTTNNSDLARNAFLQGKLALLQSGTFNLGPIEHDAKFPWGVALIPEGPAGRVSANNAVGVAGNAATRHPDAVRRVLAWLGSAEGNRYLAAAGTTIPAVVSEQQRYRDHWARRGIDVSAFFDVLRGRQLRPGAGAGLPAALLAIDPIFDEMFLGRIPVPVALDRARAAADEAINSR